MPGPFARPSENDRPTTPIYHGRSTGNRRRVGRSAATVFVRLGNAGESDRHPPRQVIPLPRQNAAPGGPCAENHPQRRTSDRWPNQQVNSVLSSQCPRSPIPGARVSSKDVPQRTAIATARTALPPRRSARCSSVHSHRLLPGPGPPRHRLAGCFAVPFGSQRSCRSLSHFRLGGSPGSFLRDGEPADVLRPLSKRRDQI
jgi:hypothetical protein